MSVMDNLTLKEIKEFLLWARDQKFSEVSIGSVSAKFTHGQEVDLSKLLPDDFKDSSEDDDDVLFWSSE